MTITIDAEKALELLQNAVNRRGADYRYEDDFPKAHRYDSCNYVVGNQPACIVGDVLITDLGLSLDQMSRYEGMGISGGMADALKATAGLSLSRGAVDILADAQSQQDVGRTWGEAYAYARTEYGNRVNWGDR